MISFVSVADNGSAVGVPGTGTIEPAQFIIPIPPCAIGDLIVLMIGAQELIDGAGAYIQNDGDIADFTDLFTDGVTGPGIAKQYHLVDTNNNVNDMFWWVGWKIADAGDAAGGTYTINCKATFHDPFLDTDVNPGVDRLKSSAIVYTGATGIDTWAAQTFADGSSTDPTVTCPTITPTGDDATGDLEFDCSPNTAPYQGGVTIALTPAKAGEKKTVICGAFGWLAGGILDAVTPLIPREQSRTGGLPDSLSWGELQRLKVWLTAPVYVGNDAAT